MAASTTELPVLRRSTRTRLSFAVVGDGEPVVLLHGIGGSARSCLPLAARLAARRHTCLAWDAPGYGESADPAATGVDHAGELVAALEELATGRVHLFGTSWGGVIAAEAAARRPDLVRSLVLADSTRGSGTTPEKARAMRGRVAELSELGSRPFAAARAPRLVAPGCDPDVAAAVEADMARVRIAGYTAAAEHMARTDLSSLLPRIAVPTLVLVGAEDRVTGVAESRVLADLVPGATLVVVPGAGHAALQERPDAFAAELTGFWARVVR